MSNTHDQPTSGGLPNDTSLPWTRLHVRWIVLWLLLSTLIVGVISDLRGLTFVTADDWLIVIFNGIIVVWIILQWRRKTLDLRELCGRIPNSAKDGLLMLAGACFALASLELQLLLRIALGSQEKGAHEIALSPEVQLLPWGSPARVGLAVLMLVAVVPMIEEILFRGILVTRWKHVFGTRIAVLLSASVFALLHSATLWALLLALLLTALYLRTGSLWISMGAHGLSNATTVTWTIVERYNSHSPFTSRISEPDIQVPLVAFGLAVAGLVMILRWATPQRARPSH